MLPIVDYGSIAIVVPQVTAVGSFVEDNGSGGFEVFLAGMNEPVMISFESAEQALESREELIAIIAQYHYLKDLGPDYDPADLFDLDEDEYEDEDEDEDEDEIHLKKDIN